MNWFKQLAAAPIPAAPRHPSNQTIVSLLNSKTDIQKTLEKIWHTEHQVGYSCVDTDGSETKKDHHIRIRVSMYFYKKYGKENFDFSEVPQFFHMVMNLLGYPPAKSYTLGEKKEDWYGFVGHLSSVNKQTIELLFTGEDIFYPNPVKIMFDFKFLEANTQEDFDALLLEVSEVAGAYFQNPNLYKIESIIQQARSELDETQHQREEPAGSATELPAPTEERRITLNHTSAKELREIIRESKYLL